MLTDLRYKRKMDCQGLSFGDNVPRGNMALIDEYARRVNWAFARLQQKSYPEKVTQTELANRVGRRVGRTYTQTAAAGWLRKTIPRDLETQEALASELDLDPSWLYFERGLAPAGWVESRANDPMERRSEDGETDQAQSGS